MREPRGSSGPSILPATFRGKRLAQQPRRLAFLPLEERAAMVLRNYGTGSLLGWFVLPALHAARSPRLEKAP